MYTVAAIQEDVESVTVEVIKESNLVKVILNGYSRSGLENIFHLEIYLRIISTIQKWVNLF